MSDAERTNKVRNRIPTKIQHGTTYLFLLNMSTRLNNTVASINPFWLSSSSSSSNTSNPHADNILVKYKKCGD